MALDEFSQSPAVGIIKKHIPLLYDMLLSFSVGTGFQSHFGLDAVEIGNSFDATTGSSSIPYNHTLYSQVMCSHSSEMPISSMSNPRDNSLFSMYWDLRTLTTSDIRANEQRLLLCSVSSEKQSELKFVNMSIPVARTCDALNLSPPIEPSEEMDLESTLHFESQLTSLSQCQQNPDIFAVSLLCGTGLVNSQSSRHSPLQEERWTSFDLDLSTSSVGKPCILEFHEGKPELLGFYGNTAVVWNLEDSFQENQDAKGLSPRISIQHSQDRIVDATFHPSLDNMILTSCSDRSVFLWDSRLSGRCFDRKFSSIVETMSWNKIGSNEILIGDEEGRVDILDLRFPSNSISRIFLGNNGSKQVRWLPQNVSCFIVLSKNGKVFILDKNATEQSNQSSSLPPEVLFQHCGQPLVSNIALCPTEWCTVASLSSLSPALFEDNQSHILQLWRPTELLQFPPATTFSMNS